MSRLEQAIPTPIPTIGWAGEYLGANPFTNLAVGGGLTANDGIWGRFNPSTSGAWGISLTGANLAANGFAYYKTRVVNQFGGAAAQGRRISALARAFMAQRDRTGNSIPPGLEEMNMTRIAVLAGYDNPAGAITGDYGLVVGTGRQVTTLRSGANNMGVMFGPITTSTIGVVIRQTDAGAITHNAALAAGFQPADITEMNLYEIVIQGASTSADALWTFYVNGMQALQLSGGAGTVLPDQINGANGMGYTVIFGSELPRNETLYARLCMGFPQISQASALVDLS
jgi:hypothetical protein